MTIPVIEFSTAGLRPTESCPRILLRHGDLDKGELSRCQEKTSKDKYLSWLVFWPYLEAFYMLELLK